MFKFQEVPFPIQTEWKSTKFQFVYPWWNLNPTKFIFTCAWSYWKSDCKTYLVSYYKRNVWEFFCWHFLKIAVILFKPIHDVYKCWQQWQVWWRFRFDNCSICTDVRNNDYVDSISTRRHTFCVVGFVFWILSPNKL
jgi:hypothetical protein